MALFVIVALVVLGLCIGAAVDAGSQPDWAFAAAGTNKTLWVVLPLVGILVCLVGVIASLIWFASIRPKVAGAVRRGAVAPPDAGRPPPPQHPLPPPPLP